MPGKITCMPHTAYSRTIATIRDYPRMKFDLERMKKEIGLHASVQDGMPKGTEVHSAVEDAAIRMADVEALILAIEWCIERVPADMRTGILNNILYRMPFPRNEYAQLVPSISTWKREKSNFVVCVAHKLRIY